MAIRPRANKNANAPSHDATGTNHSYKEPSVAPRVVSTKTKGKPRRHRSSTTLVLIGMGAVMSAMIVMGMISMLFRGTTNRNNNNNNNENDNNISSSSSSQNLRKPLQVLAVSPAQAGLAIQNVRDRFAARYGDYSDRLLERGVQAFGSLDATAIRILEAARNGRRPFVFAFSGYSVTVGRGNFFNQSFPFEVGRILNEPFQTIFGIDVVVRNGAIGGIPSFPYGFCLEHFLGTDPDVISWDYSMNEGGRDSSVLESFIRQALQQLPKRPMLIMLDQNEARSNLLAKYTTTTASLLPDAIAVGKKDILESDVVVFEGDNVAPGFQDWDVFGAPKQCPGRGSWHPKKQEHAMIGWMIAMHFIRALERAVELQQLDTASAASQTTTTTTTPLVFPQPFSNIPNNNQDVTDLLYGHHEVEGDDYRMKDLSCRTSFLPATDHSKVLPSVVVGGLAAEGELDIMIDRTDAHYQKGWMLDVSKVERDTKRKVERCGGLGYLDMKIAMYGIPESGTLRLWLPFEGPSHEGHGHEHEHEHDANINAKHWFDDLIICEANDKRGETACHLDHDLEVVVGGAPVTSIGLVKGAGEYLKRTTCVNVGVPETAQITKLGQVVVQPNGKPLSAEEKRKKFAGLTDDAVGLVVDITVKAGVTRDNGACCLSHIVWEQH
jgi:hypothetical protein